MWRVAGLVSCITANQAEALVGSRPLLLPVASRATIRGARSKPFQFTLGSTQTAFPGKPVKNEDNGFSFGEGNRGNFVQCVYRVGETFGDCHGFFPAFDGVP